MDNASVIRLLKQHSFNAVELQGTEGGSIIVMDAGARVLRVVGQSGRDFLWLNDAFRGGDPGELFKPDGWLNFGGDRTWIAPESDLFVADLADPWGTYKMPESIDPGHYSISSDGSAARVAGECRVVNYRLREEANLTVEKLVHCVPNPLRDIRAVDAEYVGYKQQTTLTMAAAPDSVLKLGLWHLAQLRSTGEILIPVTTQDRPRDYLDRTDPDHLVIEQGLVRFKVDAAAKCKIGIKAASLFGRSGYLRQEEDGLWSLIVRNFFVDPSAHYVDTPWDDLNDSGYALQCYNDDGNFADFGEMEYHAPAVDGQPGRNTYTDRSQLWAFRGERSAITEVAQRLLGLRAGER